MPSSYNGWTASRDRKAIGVVPFKVAGIDFPGGVKGGDVATVLGYVAEQFHRRVERLVSPGCWGYNYRQNRNANNLSCHASGTAIDLNAPKHPNGQFPTFTPKQVTAMREILAEVDHAVRWGYDFTGTKDPMHVEIVVNAATLAKVAAKIRKAQSAAKTPTTVKKAVVVTPADPRLHQGTKGPRVADVQRALVKLGYKVVVDGDWGPGTDRAFRAFQKAGRRNPDGITWAADWKALRR